MECHPGAAGYIQAIGTIAAVLIAFWAPQISERFERHSRIRRTKLRDREVVNQLEEPVQQLIDQFDKLYVRFGKLLEKGEPFATNELRATIPVPLEFIDQSAAGASLEAVGDIEKFVAQAKSFNSMMAAFVMIDPKTVEWVAVIKEILAVTHFGIEAKAATRKFRSRSI
jgi:hypothetical protein